MTNRTENTKVQQFQALGLLRQIQVLGMAERAQIDYDEKLAVDKALNIREGYVKFLDMESGLAVLQFRYKGDYIYSGAALVEGTWVRDNTNYTNVEQGFLSAISIKHGAKGTQYVDFAWSMLKGPRP